MNVETVIRYLDDDTTYQSNYSDGTIKTSFRTNPKDYIQFAEKDLLKSSPHGNVNALSNIKRAMCCQVDRLLKLLGYFARTANAFEMDFMTKVSTIQSYGISIPEQLSGIIKERNAMEHNYQQPENEMIKEMFGTITQFIFDTEFFVSKFPVSVEYSNHLKQLDYGFYNLSLYVNRGEKCIHVTSGEAKTTIRGKSSLYVEVFKRHLLKTRATRGSLSDE